MKVTSSGSPALTAPSQLYRGPGSSSGISFPYCPQHLFLVRYSWCISLFNAKSPPDSGVPGADTTFNHLCGPWGRVLELRCARGDWESRGSGWGHSRLRTVDLFSRFQQHDGLTGTFCLDTTPGWMTRVCPLLTPSASLAHSRCSIDASRMNE